MIKNCIMLFFGLLLLSLNQCYAVDSNYDDTPETQVKFQHEYSEDDFNFNDSSSYLTDEQLQEAQEINEIDDNVGFWAKIINSSHFSSGTATKTYIPINKIQ